jgi:hypothetical protein
LKFILDLTHPSGKLIHRHIERFGGVLQRIWMERPREHILAHLHGGHDYPFRAECLRRLSSRKHLGVRCYFRGRR